MDDNTNSAQAQRPVMPRRWPRRLLVTLSIMLLPIVLLAGVWQLGGVSALEDDLLYYLPIRDYIGRCIRQGELPTWNPLVGMGTPVAADPQAGLWYPTTWLFAAMPRPWAYPTTLVLHFILAGAGMYRLLRSYRLDWRACWIGAVAFEFSGYLVAHRAHLTIHHAAAWIPWIFLGWRLFARKGQGKYWALAVGALGMQLLVQHIQITIITLALLSGYLLCTQLWRRRSLLYEYPAGLLVALMFAAVQITPTYFQFTDSIRSAPAYNIFNQNSYVPPSLITFVAPMFFGTRTPNFYDQPWWGISHFCEQSAYATILILILAIASLRLVGARREILYWVAACIVAGIIALGDATPVGQWLFEVPVYRNLRVPARWVLVWSFALPILAAFTLHALLRPGIMRDKLRRATRIVIPLPIVLILGIAALTATAIMRIDSLRERYADMYYTNQVLDGLQSAVRLDNWGFWVPIAVVLLSCLALSHWLRNEKHFPLLVGVFLIDLALVVPFVDVNTTTYTREDLREPPPLATAIRELDPKLGQRLLVPRRDADYEQPLQVLWPETNMLWEIPTFNAYGPLQPIGQRLLFRFMPWGASQEMLALLRNPALMRSMGIRFIAVRSEQERKLLHAAMLPAIHDPPEPIPGTDKIVPVVYGRDLLWPIRIETPGVYELAFDARPVAGSASRWYVRLETADHEEIVPTRWCDPVDLAAGPRRMRFVFNVPQQALNAYVRVKAEMGHALSAGHGTFRCIARGKPSSTAPFVERRALPDGVRLYELPQATPLVHWPEMIICVPDLVSAVEALQSARDAAWDGTRDTLTVLEQAGSPIPRAVKATAAVRYTRPAPDRIEIHIDSGRKGPIIINESFDAGWQATANGRPVPIERCNGVVMAVQLEGDAPCDLQLVYQTRGLRAGAALSLAGLLALMWAAIRTRPGSATYKGSKPNRTQPSTVFSQGGPEQR